MFNISNLGKDVNSNLRSKKEYRDLSPEELQSIESLSSVLNNFSNGILEDIGIEDLQEYLSNPERNKDKLEKYAMYQYITEGDIFQLFDLIRVLPNLNYKIETLKPNMRKDNHIIEIRKVLKDINHKELTRDLLSQVVTSGTVVGLWVGRENQKSKDTPYLIVFDNLEYFFPARRINGKWTVWCDLSYFDSTLVSKDKKYEIINNLSPYVTIKDYDNYKKNGEEYRYIEFPVERSVVLRTHTLKRNQRFGIPWNTQAIYDIKHKEKLRNLEKVASNKVMNAVAVLTLGLKDSQDSTYKKLGEKITRSVFNNVKKGLVENKDGEASVVGLPEWAKLEYPDQKTDVLDPDKIETINEDINNSTGIPRTLTNGTSGNYASAKLALEIIHSRIGELLENIESEVYNKLLKIILPKSVGDYYYFEYEKSYPLSNKEKVDTLIKLHGLGYSLKPVIDMLGLDFTDYVNQSVYEIETLKMREKIYPPLSTYTATSDDVGAVMKDNIDSELNGNSNNNSTIQSNENGGNESPEANV